MEKAVPAYHPKFDVFRGVAAIVVLLAHVVQVYVARLIGPDSWAAVLTETLARHAVLVFFLLSGYLITLSIHANVRRHGRFDAVEYLTARIARIYPPLCGAILLTLAAGGVIHLLDLPGATAYGLPTDQVVVRKAFTLSAKDVVLALAMQNGLLQANGPLWSLYMEFHLYVIAMLAVKARPVWIAASAALLAGWSYLTPSFVFFAAVWALGALIAVGMVHVDNGLLRRIAATSSCFAAICLVCVSWTSWQGYLAQALFCVLYAHLMFFSSLFNRAMPAALVATGNCSYSLYVIHFPLLLLGLSIAQNWMGTSPARTVAVSAVMAAAAFAGSVLFARYFEDQKRFKGRIRTLLVQARSAVRQPRALS